MKHSLKLKRIYRVSSGMPFIYQFTVINNARFTVFGFKTFKNTVHTGNNGMEYSYTVGNPGLNVLIRHWLLRTLQHVYLGLGLIALNFPQNSVSSHCGFYRAAVVGEREMNCVTPSISGSTSKQLAILMEASTKSLNPTT